MLMQLFQSFLSKTFNPESDETKRLSIFPIVKILFWIVVKFSSYTDVQKTVSMRALFILL